MEPFVHLGARSDFSIGAGMARVEQLCRLAAKDGQKALGLCDAMTLAGAPALRRACRRLGITPVFGVELRVAPLAPQPAGAASFPLRVLAGSTAGWRRIIHLVNSAQGGSETAGAVTWDAVLAECEGLFLLPGGCGSELSVALLEDRLEDAEALLEMLTRRAGAERVFVALPAPAENPGEEAARLLYAAAGHFGLGAVAVPDVRYALPEDELAWRLWSAQGREAFAPGTRVRDLVRPRARRHHLLTQEEAGRLYEAFPGAVENAARLAGLCTADFAPVAHRFPSQEFERGVDTESYIWNEVFARASQHYGDLPTRWRERLNREFRDLIEADLGAALLCLSRLDGELRTRGLLRGPGAGFLTNSLVAALLGVTQLDPLRHDLPFSLPEGAAQHVPRIELLLPESALEGAGEAVGALFEGHTSLVGRWQRWTASPILERLMRQVGWQGKPCARMMKTKGWTDAIAAAAVAPEGQDPPEAWLLSDVKTLAWMVHRLEGRARRLRTVPNEYVFSSGPMVREIPRSPASDGHIVTQWEAKDLESLGHGRIAFLRDPMLDLVDAATAHLKEQGRLPRLLASAPAEDAKTYELLREGRVQGLRLFESPAARRRLRQLQPSDLASLVRVLRGGPGARRLARESPSEFESLMTALWGAALKAHEPEAFFAAALSLAAAHPAEGNALLEEARAGGLRIRPVDVNYSGWHWTPEDGGLRPGLIVVRGMTEEAWREIGRLRHELAFNDLADLLKRTDPRLLKTGQVEALIRAGALDSFGSGREELLANLPRLDQLLRPRRGGEATEEALQFFGRGSDWWLENQILRTEWVRIAGDESPEGRAERQRAATALYLEVDPLDMHREFRRAARLISPRDLGNRDRGREVSLLAPIGALQPLEASDGKAALAEIGHCQVELHGDALQTAMTCQAEADWIVVAGTVEREAFQWIVTADCVVGFEEAARRAQVAVALHLLPGGLEAAALKELLALLKHYPGRTPVRLQDVAEPGIRLLAKIAGRKVTVCPGLEAGLKRLLPPGTWRVEVPAASVEEATAREVVAMHA
ncbi:MAG: polymerase subunit alpha [Candidatus Sumerlaeota bacterium]|nr:polymerase subunit alpha [Candidatus Sumerlaeota bacterium]